MELNEQLSSLNTKEEFINFLQNLMEDNTMRKEEWISGNINSYIDAISSWTEDMDGYYNNIDIETPQNINWNFIATLFYVGKFYE